MADQRKPQKNLKKGDEVGGIYSKGALPKYNLMTVHCTLWYYMYLHVPLLINRG